MKRLNCRIIASFSVYNKLLYLIPRISDWSFYNFLERKNDFKIISFIFKFKIKPHSKYPCQTIVAIKMFPVKCIFKLVSFQNVFFYKTFHNASVILSNINCTEYRLLYKFIHSPFLFMYLVFSAKTQNTSYFYSYSYTLVLLLDK